MTKQNNTLLLSATVLIVFAAFTRLFPHYPNFTAIGAMAIFGGTVVQDKKFAFLLPLGALLLSDICLELFTDVSGFYGNGQFLVYGAFALITWLATFIRKKNVVNIALASVWSGLIFFIISNFGEWLFSSYSLYPKTLSGLLQGYVAAIPFYRGEIFGSFFLNTIFGNLFYGSLLFGSYYVIRTRVEHRNSYAV